MAGEASRRLWFFQSLERVSSALRADHDYDVLLRDTLEVTLSVLDCDRAWLVYPCDAEADVQRVVVERTRAGWERNVDDEAGFPVSKEIAALVRKILASDVPVCTGEDADAKVPDNAARLGVRASMVQAVRPKMEQPYVFGVHRCAEARGWNEDERRLFQEIGRRLGDALTACFVIERLRENERRLETELAERQATEKRLHANEALFRAVVDHATDALFLHGERGQILDVNQGACDSLGYTREELLGMSPFDFDPDVTPDGAREMVARLEAGDVVAFDTHHRRKDGTTFPVEVRIRRFSDGTRHLSVSLARDISARKQSEERLRTSEERFRELAENIDDVFWVTDASKSEMLYVSPAYEKIWGRSCKSLYASPQSWLDPIQPNDRERVLAAAMTKQAEGAYDEEYRIVRPDGQVRWIRDIAFPVRDASGNLLRVVGVARDMTDRRLLQEQLFHAQKLEAIGQLAGGVAHDFNNILAVVLGECDLAPASLPPDVLEHFANIRAAADLAIDLTRQLLLFSRRQVMQQRVLDLNEAVVGITKLVERIIGEDIRVEVRRADTPLTVFADPGMVEQLLMNLVVNARDAMPNGGTLSIETSERVIADVTKLRRPETTPGRYGCVRVADSGEGIAPEVLPRIFEPFFTTKERGRGTGLGLATAFGIVKQHHGWIDVQSSPGAGTTFEIFLPLREAPAAAGQVVVAEVRGGTETILVVEDDSSVRRVTRRVLAAQGYRILEAASGDEALRIYAEHRAEIALVLTDLVMPGDVNGRELAKRLTKSDPRIRVIFMSGYSADVAGRELELRIGENFLPKPFTRVELLATIRRALDRPQASGPASL